jgi:hypothetical protein
MLLRRRSTAVWRSCQRHATGSSIGSCKQSLQDVRLSPVGPGKDLQSLNEQRSILTRSNGTHRNCIASGASWLSATTRGLRLAGSIFSVRSNFWVDDLEQVERNLSRLEHTAETHSLAPARAVALGLRGRYLAHIGRMADGIERMQESLEKLAHHRYEVVTADLVSELTVSLAKQNRRSEALALVDRSIAAVIKANRLLRLPAFLLAKGLAFALGELPETLLAEEFLAKAMMQARQESALPFELRAGLELARIWMGRGEVQRAHDLISPVYNRFSEGLATPDLTLASRILERESVPAPDKPGEGGVISSGRELTSG